jgi:PKD-like domain/CHU_C Type IX secretion signal domain
MKKNLLLLFFVAVFAQFNAIAQEGTACPDPPPPGGGPSCSSTCVYCDFDGFMGINNGGPSGGNVVCGAISLHNDFWFGFVAGTSTITIDLITSNCQTGDGLQAAIWDNCDDADALVCNPGCSGCGGQTITISYSGFTPGETYWYMIDGYIGDVCNWEISVTEGSITPPPADPATTPQGPTMVCPGATAVYSVPDAFGAGFYHWTSPPGSQINGLTNNQNINAPGGAQVTVTFGSQGGNVCVQTGNSCNPLTPLQCLPVTNMPIPVTVKPPLVICNDDIPFTWDEEPYNVLNSAGTFTLNSTPYDSYLGCDSIVRQTVTIKPPLFTTMPTQYICAGSCFNFAGQQYCDPGLQQVVLQSFQGCDSLVNFSIAVLSPNAQITGNTPITCGTQGGLNLMATNFVSGSSFQWTNANWNFLGAQSTQNVNSTGVYNLVVSVTGGGLVCRDTASVTVTGNTVPPGATATNTNINCISTTASLTGSSPTNGVNYFWAGPGITPANQNQQNPVVNQQGVYTLTVTNPVNSCTSTAQVTVIADNVPPSISAVGGSITCTQSSVTINGTTNVGSPNWLWTGPGIIPANQNMEDPTVSQSGWYYVTVTNSVNGCTNRDSAEVILNTTIPTASAGPDQTLTCSFPDRVLQGAGNTGLAPMGVLWTGPGGFTNTALNPTVNQPGLYILTITNLQNGCVKKDSVDIAINQVPPTANAGTDSTITCDHPSVTLLSAGSSSGPNFTRLWSGPGINGSNQNQGSPMVNLPGNYTLLITNNTNGCTATDMVVVNIDVALPTANAGSSQTLTCSNPNGVILSGSGTPANVTYFWTGPGIGANNENQQSPTVTQPGTYILQTTNPVNGCTATDQVTVAQDANVPNAEGGPDRELNCTVNTVNFDGSGSSTGVDITYMWTGPGISGVNMTAQSPTGLTVPGTYNLTVTNTTNNCINTDIVVITQNITPPIANAGMDLVLNCFNGAIDTLDASASSSGSIYTYLWAGPGITPANQNLEMAPINNQPGLYSITVTNTDNTCTSVDQVMVTSDLAPPTADAGTDEVIDCVNLSTSVGGSSSSGPDFTYLWTGPGITPANETLATPTVSQPGTYTIVVTDNSNGCTQSDNMVISTNAVYPTASAGADRLLTCVQLDEVLNGSGSSMGANFSLLWTGPGITPANQTQTSPSVTVPGTYIVAITNTANSCISRDTVVVDQDIDVPAASAGVDKKLDCMTTTVVLNGSMSASGANITYLWAGPGITPANETQKSPSVTQPGNYSILVTNTANGCTATDNVEITQDIAAPTASAGTDLLLTCGTPSIAINGSGSSTGANFGYVWQGNDITTGNFNVQNPMVADSGTYILIVTNNVNFCTATDIVFVGMNKQAPTVEAGPDRTLTCALTTVQLDGSQSQAGPSISYLWSGPGILPGQQTSATPTVNATGIYNLVITNALNGCTSTDFANVGENVTLPSANAGSNLVITCANSTTGVNINSTGSSVGPEFTYLWTGSGITPSNQSQANPTVLSAGTYTLVVTNSTNGCTETDNMEVTLDQNLPTPSAGMDQTLTCAITSVSIDASGSTSPSGSLSYSWAGPGINAGNATDVTPVVTVAGIYTVTVMNPVSGCFASDQVEVFLNNTQPTVTTTTDIITCADPNGNLSVSSSANGSTFNWEGPGINASNATLAAFTVSQAGVYSVTVTAPNGCTSTSSTTMAIDDDVPNGTAEGGTLNCINGGTIDVSGQVSNPPGTTVNWTGPGIGTVNANSVSVTQPGTYTFTMTTPAGCTQAIPVQVLANFTPPEVMAAATDQLDCSTTTVGLNGGGSSVGPNFNYLWTTNNGNIVSGATTLNPVVDAAGIYQLYVLNTINGCADSLQVPVTIDPAVPTGFDLTVRDIICFGDTDGSIQVNGIVGGTTPFNFTLTSNSGTTTNQYTGLTAGDYTLSLLDANGCELDTVISIGEPGQLVVSLGPDVEIELGDDATVSVEIVHTTPLLSVTWNYSPNCDSMPAPGTYCDEFTYTPLNSYRHTITVVDSNGCKASDAVMVIVNKPRNIFIPNIFNPNSIDIDNAGVRIYMGRDVAKVHKWLIFDRWGELVYEVQDVLPGDTDHGWNGQVKGDKGMVGVYVYYAKVEFIDGEIIEYKGDITLIR